MLYLVILLVGWLIVLCWKLQHKIGREQIIEREEFKQTNPHLFPHLVKSVKVLKDFTNLADKKYVDEMWERYRSQKNETKITSSYYWKEYSSDWQMAGNNLNKSKIPRKRGRNTTGSVLL